MLFDDSDNESDQSVETDAFGFRVDFLEVPEYKRAGTTTVDFDGLLTQRIKLQEDLKEGCGGQLWPAGMTLGKYLLRNCHRLKNKTMLVAGSSVKIIELGAGGGLTGLALAQKLYRDFGDDGLNGTSFTLTDQEVLLGLMQDNIKLNELPDSLIKASVLDWSTEDLQIKQPDIVLAADCVYFEPAFPLLLKTLKHLIGPTTICYFCFKKRRKADLKFIKDARKLFKIEDVDDDPDKPIWSREALFLYRITQK